MTTKEERIEDYLNEGANLVDICANYHEESGEGVEFFEMDRFDDEMESFTPTEIVQAVQYTEFSLNDDYFFIDGDSEVHSFNDLDDEFCLEDIANYCVENNTDLGDYHIREILDSKEGITLTLHLYNGETETHTFDSLKEEYEGAFFKIKDGYSYYDYDELVEHFEDTDDDTAEIFLYDIEEEMKRKGRKITILGYEGYVFGNETYLDEGRHFLYFYEPVNDMLMKLVYEKPSIIFDDIAKLERPYFIKPVYERSANCIPHILDSLN